MSVDLWFVAATGRPVDGRELRDWIVVDGHMNVDTSVDPSTWVATWRASDAPWLELVWETPDDEPGSGEWSGLSGVLSLPADEDDRAAVEAFLTRLEARFDLRATDSDIDGR